MASQTLLDKIRKKQREVKASMSTFWTPAEGPNEIRIMPSWLGPEGEWYFEVIMHYELPDRKFAACLKQFGSECPICEAVEALMDSNKAADQKLASKMMAKENYIVNVGLPNKPDGLVQVWRMGKPMFLELLGFYMDDGDFSHPKTGYNFRLTRNGTGLKTRYEPLKIAKPNPSPLVIEGWKKKLRRLDQIEKPKSRKELRSLLAGEDD